MEKLYQIDTGYACGGILVRDGIVIGGAPIFRKLVGKSIESVGKVYKMVEVDTGQEFSIIVSGSRKGKFSSSDKMFLKLLKPTLVISGGQTGIDTEAKNWAEKNGIKFKPFKANWGEYGNKAGPIRNLEMANYLVSLNGRKAVVLFPGGSGTASMRGIAKDSGLETIERKVTNIEESLNEVVASWTGCQSCSLYRRRTWQVWGRTIGALRRGGLVLVGEAPGEAEDRQGEAFVGRSGVKLDSMMGAAKITDAFITNTVLCRPPSNRDPKNSEMRKCFGRLQRFLVELQPKVIVTIGKCSSNFLLENDFSMGGLVACEYDWDLGSLLSCVVIPVYHPSYLLRNHSAELEENTIERLRLAWSYCNDSNCARGAL